MIYNKLYVIGNGFDIHHGINSRYINFKEYLEVNDKRLLEKVEEYFGYEETLWSNFEETLAQLDTEQITYESMNYLEQYGSENWGEDDNYKYQYEVQRRIDLITVTLKQEFTKWILQLKLPQNVSQNMVVIDKNATFINFNYTDTLENLYRISQDQILYIHNKAIDSNSTLILGHSRNPNNTKKSNELYNDEDVDIRVIEGDKILDDYFLETYKSTHTIITENSDFFIKTKDVDIIYVFGHSLSNVDKPYFHEIIKHIDQDKVTWKVSYYSNVDLANFKAFFQELGISDTLIEFDKMSNFDTGQKNLFTNTINQ